jgi:hypothetical protein
MSTPVRTAAASLQVFLKGIIDYAGLFAPASLEEPLQDLRELDLL